MKRFLLLPIIALSLIGCSNGNSDTSGGESTKPVLLPYDIDKTGCINRFYANDKNSENIVIPSTYSIDEEGRIISGSAYQVKKISEFCFANNNLIKTVFIPDTVEIIDSSAFFNCSNLEKINVPSSVTTLGTDAFGNCPKLLTLSGTENSGNLVLSENDNLSSFIIPASITSLDYKVFTGWDKLASLSVVESVTKIKGGSIKNCKAISSVTIQGVLAELGDDVFTDCGSLNKITFSQIPTIKKYVLPTSVTALADNAFYNWTSLEELYLHENVTMKSNIFKNNYSLKKVTCPDTMFLSLFYSHTSDYPVVEDEHLYTSQRKPSSSSTLRYYYIPKTLTDIELLGNKDRIEDGCFSGLTSVKNIRLHSGIETFSYGSFCNLTNLQNVYFSTTYQWEYICNYYTDDYGTISQATMNSSSALASALKQHFNNSYYYWRAQNG